MPFTRSGSRFVGPARGGANAGVTIVSPGANLGFGGGCELGALHARGEVLAFVNPDVIYAPGWFEPPYRSKRLDDAAVNSDFHVLRPAPAFPASTFPDSSPSPDDRNA